MRAVAMGVHVLDVLVRPVEEIPEGQGGELVEQIRITAAGSAGGTALTLAKLGAEVRSAGRDRHRRGRRDAARAARATAESTRRCSCAATTSRPRPACCRSAPTAAVRPSTWSAPTPRTGPTTSTGTARRRRPTSTSAVPSSWAARPRREILAAARERGIVTSADVLAPGEPGLLEWIAPALRATSTTSCPTTTRCSRSPAPTTSRPAAGRWSSAGSAASPRPAAPTACCWSTPTASRRVPAFEIEVVDTTGCGDAFSAGFLRGLSLGRDRAEAAGSATPPRLWSPRASAPTTATSTSRPPRRSRRATPQLGAQLRRIASTNVWTRRGRTRLPGLRSIPIGLLAFFVAVRCPASRRSRTGATAQPAAPAAARCECRRTATGPRRLGLDDARDAARGGARGGCSTSMPTPRPSTARSATTCSSHRSSSAARPPRPRPRRPVEPAIRAVIGQQVSLAAARTLAGRLVAAHGDPLARPLGEVTHVFPSPRARRAPTRGCRCRAARARGLHGLAAANPLDRRRRGDREGCALPGMGHGRSSTSRCARCAPRRVPAVRPRRPPRARAAR